MVQNIGFKLSGEIIFEMMKATMLALEDSKTTKPQKWGLLKAEFSDGFISEWSESLLNYGTAFTSFWNKIILITFENL